MHEMLGTFRETKTEISNFTVKVERIPLDFFNSVEMKIPFLRILKSLYVTNESVASFHEHNFYFSDSRN